jgi:signal transduction histidine kinase
MRQLRVVLWPIGLVFGLAAEAADPAGGWLTAADLAVGLALIGFGLIASERQAESRIGVLLTASGFAWFLGNFADWAIYLHRGLLAHAVLSYPGARIRSRLVLAVVLGIYVYAVLDPVADNDGATIVVALVIPSTALYRYLSASGTQRKAREFALLPAATLAAALAVGAVTRTADAGAGRAVLWAYDIAILATGGLLFAGLLWGRWAQATVTGLVVDLGEPGDAGTLRDRLAHALGDPSLVVGYWLPDESRYIDEAGRPVDLPPAGSGRTITPIEQDGASVAALVHDVSVLGEPGLVGDVAAATRLAVANVRLQADVRARVAEVEASRRRIVEAGDVQRRRLERELREGAGQRLDHVADLLYALDPPLSEAATTLEAARHELRELARGIHPATLIERGLAEAIRELATRCPVAVEVVAPPGRFAPAVEAVVYFVCSEGLANVAKYAGAARASVRLRLDESHLFVEVADDGVGGADPASGSGLRGLADRVAALGGRFEVESPRGRGTRMMVALPLARGD